MQNTPETNKHFDIATLKKYVGDMLNDDILSIAIGEIQKSLAVFTQHVQNKHLKGLNEAGHKLYGTAATLGLGEVARLSREFEYMKTYNEAEVAQRFDEMTAEINLVIPLMREQLSCSAKS